jgi:hypothetical protein
MLGEKLSNTYAYLTFYFLKGQGTTSKVTKENTVTIWW